MSKDITSIRKRRGVVRASITRLVSRLTELEEMPDQEAANRHAQRLSTRMSALDSEFKSIHFQLIDLIDVEDEGTIEKEQDIMDKHDDDIDSLTIRVQGLLVASRTISASSDHRLLLRKPAHLEESLTTISDTITTLPPDGLEDLALIQQYQEELSDHKGQLMNLYDGLAGLELEEGDELLVLHSKLKKLHFDCCHKVRKILNSRSTLSTSSVVTEAKSLKIPKLDAPAFDGNILNWTNFWEQFTISINEHSNLTDAEKFMYLLKEGSAKSVIEGLSGSSKHYAMAVEMFKGSL